MRYVTRRADKKGDRWYWQRKGWPLTRLPDDERERYAAAYALNEEADKGAKPAARAKKPSPGSVAGVIASYKAADRYTKLADASKVYYDDLLANLEDAWGAYGVGTIKRPNCLKWIERAPKLAERRKRRTVLRVVLEHAKDRGFIVANPTDGIELATPRARQEFFDDDALTAFVKACREHKTHGWMVYVGFMLLLFTGQRPSDVLKMTWGQYDGRTIKLRQKKTGKLVELPAHPQLKAMLDAMPRQAMVILTHEERPVPRSTYNKHYIEVRRSAGLDGKQMRDLRRTAVVRMAEGGAEIQDIAAVTGHSIERTKQILEVYMPRTLKMAERGVARMANLSLTF